MHLKLKALDKFNKICFKKTKYRHF